MKAMGNRTDSNGPRGIMNSKGRQPREVGRDITIKAQELVLSLPSRIPSLRVLNFTKYKPRPGSDERLPTSDEVAWRARALASISKNKTLAWKSFIIASSPTQRANGFIREALKHSAPKFLRIPAGDLSQTRLEEERTRLSDDQVLALCSSCELLDGRARHIPMMDFMCVCSSTNLQKIKRALIELGQEKGAIVDSGRSYHFYGFDLMKQREWEKFLARCLLLYPLTDSRYIAHCLLGDAVLRITHTKTEIKPREPTVIEYL